MKSTKVFVLHYFDVRNRAEVARQLFALAEKEYEDKRYTMEEFPEVKSKFPFGQMPVLEINGKYLPQTLAINRYLAHEFGFTGRTAFERGWVDALADHFQDYYIESRGFLYCLYGFSQGDVKQLQKEVGEPARDKYFGYYESKLKKSKSGFMVGENVTVIDLQVAEHADVLEGFIPGYLAQFPKVLAHKEKVQSIPQLKAYLERRPKRPF